MLKHGKEYKETKNFERKLEKEFENFDVGINKPKEEKKIMNTNYCLE